MFNQGDSRGFDLINHAIRMGTVGEVLRRSDLLRQLNAGSDPPFIGRPPPPQPPQASPQQTVSAPHNATQAGALSAQVQVPAAAPAVAAVQRQSSDRLNPNAFQFPWKLHDMLDTAAADGSDYIVSWQEDGRSFRVHKPQTFVDNVMPLYFKQTKYKSFQRQLNLYGFTRINEGPGKGGYRHKYFIRGQRNLCQLISRTSTADAPASAGNDFGGSSPAAARRGSNASHRSNSGVAPNDATPNVSSAPPAVHVTVPPANNVALTNPIAASIPSFASLPQPLAPAQGDDDEDDEKRPADFKALMNKEFQFPWKLHEMLERSFVEAFDDIVSWQHGDTCFKVHDPNKFVETVMPRFFKQTKYKSFQRQLNLYGFTRIDEGANKGGYYHQFFQKGRKDLLNSMSRQKIRNDKPDETEAVPTHSGGAAQPEPTNTAAPAFSSGINAVLEAIKRSEQMQIDNRDGSQGDSQETANHPQAAIQPSDTLSWRQTPSESFSDWVIEVVEKETQTRTAYNVHRRVLAVGPRRSEFFSRLFKKLNTSNRNCLQLGSVEASVFPLMLDHMYADADLQLNTEKAYALYCLAEQLEVASVLLTVTDFYRKNMTRENSIDFIELGQSFNDKTLLHASMEKCAEDIRSMDQTMAAKFKPDLLLQVLLKSKALPKSYKCGSSRLSLLVAESVQSHCETVTVDIFKRLTEKEQLPYIEPTAAIKLLAVENILLSRLASATGADTSLHERCILSICKEWDKLRIEIEMDVNLSFALKSISSPLLFDILMRTTKKES